MRRPTLIPGWRCWAPTACSTCWCWSRSAGSSGACRSAPPARIWLLAAGAQLLLIGIIGFLVAHHTGEQLPRGWLTAMRVVWLTGLALLGLFAILPAAEAAGGTTVGTDRRPRRRPAITSWTRPRLRLGPAARTRPSQAATLLAVALLGPPLEIARSGLANLVTLCLVAMVFLLLREAWRRAQGGRRRSARPRSCSPVRRTPR